MRCRAFAVVAVAAVSSFVLVTSREARADEAPLPAPAVAPAPGPVIGAGASLEAPPAPDAVSGDDARPAFKSVTLSLNPLSFALGRMGMNVEYLPAVHHAIVANPFFQSISVGSDTDKTTYSNIGGELGYHYYTGRKGANGFFVGPSLFVMSAKSRTTVTGSDGPSEASVSIFSYGAALDVGGQHVFDNGLTIGGGAGLMYLVASNDTTQTSSTVKLSGVLPRVLFTVGYSF